MAGIDVNLSFGGIKSLTTEVTREITKEIIKEIIKEIKTLMKSHPKITAKELADLCNTN